MKARLFILGLVSLLPCGCGFLSHTLNTVTRPVSGLLNTVTAPVSGIVHAADEGSEKAWADKAAAGKQKAPAHSESHDRRRTP